MKNTCLHSINGICEIFSDETVLQPCIEEPCKNYEEKLTLTELEKEKICACIGYQINKFYCEIDKLYSLPREFTDKEYSRLCHFQNAAEFYNNLIKKIKSV